MQHHESLVHAYRNINIRLHTTDLDRPVHHHGSTNTTVIFGALVCVLVDDSTRFLFETRPRSKRAPRVSTSLARERSHVSRDSSTKGAADVVNNNRPTRDLACRFFSCLVVRISDNRPHSKS